jgi:hypothetical protein
VFFVTLGLNTRICFRRMSNFEVLKIGAYGPRPVPPLEKLTDFMLF